MTIPSMKAGHATIAHSRSLWRGSRLQALGPENRAFSTYGSLSCPIAG